MSRKNKYSLLQTKTAVTSLYSLQASTHRHTTTPTSKQPKKSGSVSVSEHTPTPPLTKQQSTDNKLGLMLSWGGEGWVCTWSNADIHPKIFYVRPHGELFQLLN